MSNFVPSPEQQAILDAVQKRTENLAIEARAGSGKTTILLEIARRLPRSGNRLFCAFNRSIVSELERKLDGTGVTTKTFHSIGLGSLARALGWSGLPNPNTLKYRSIMTTWAESSSEFSEAIEAAILNAPQDQAESSAKEMRREALKMGTEVLNWLRYKLIDPTDEVGLMEMISRYRLDEDIMGDDGIISAVVGGVPEMMLEAEAQTKQRVIDYTDQIYWVVKWDSPVKRYQYIFTDEAQDLSPMQRRLIEKSLDPNGRIFVVGDPRQAIYEFAGSDSDSFDLTVDTFNCHVLPMTVTRRCAQVITRHAARIVSDFQALPTSPRGKVIWWTEDRMLEVLKPGDMVLSRVRAPLIKGVLECIGARMPATILGSEIGKALISILDKLERRNGFEFARIREVLDLYTKEQVERYTAKGDEAMVATVEDSQSALLAVIDYANASSIDQLKGEIDVLFSDKDSKTQITFTTIHKSKGLEADRVFILSPDKLPLGGGDQEDNLDYVARTRAKSALVYLTNPKFLEKTPRPAYVQTTFDDLSWTDELPFSTPERPVITVEKPEVPQLSLPAPLTTPEPGLAPVAAQPEVSPVGEAYPDGGRAALDALKGMDLMVMLEDVEPAPVPAMKLPPQVERITEVLNDLTLTEIDAVIRVLTIYKQVMLREAALEAV